MCNMNPEKTPSFICSFKSIVKVLEESRKFVFDRENIPNPSFEAVFRHTKMKNPGNARTTIPGFSISWKIEDAGELESQTEVS